MQKSTRRNGQPLATQDNPHVVEEIEAVSRRVPTADVAGAALRSMLIGAVLVGGITWLARVMLHRQARGRGSNDKM